MFSVESFLRLNAILSGAWRLAYLNLLWIVTTVLGLVVFGIGPATYAVAAYVDRWYRFGETPPVAPTFIALARAHYWHAAAMGWIFTAAYVIVLTNIFTMTNWYLQFANIVALVVVSVIAAYVFPVMAATDVRGIGRQIAAALMLGIGSLHWTIAAGATVVGTVWLLANFALPALLVFGIGIPAAAIGFVTRIIFTQLAADARDAADADATGTPRNDVRTPAPSLHPARGTAQ